MDRRFAKMSPEFGAVCVGKSGACGSCGILIILGVHVLGKFRGCWGEDVKPWKGMDASVNLLRGHNNISIWSVNESALPRFEARDTLGTSHYFSLEIGLVIFKPDFSAEAKGCDDSHDTDCDGGYQRQLRILSVVHYSPRKTASAPFAQASSWTPTDASFFATSMSKIPNSRAIRMQAFCHVWISRVQALEYLRIGRSRDYLMADTVNSLQRCLDRQLQTTDICYYLGTL